MAKWRWNDFEGTVLFRMCFGLNKFNKGELKE